MEQKKTKWYLFGIVSKLKITPLQVISYLLAFLTDIAGTALAIYFSVYFIRIGGMEERFYDYSPSYNYGEELITVILSFLLFISFLLLCASYIKKYKGIKRVLMCIGAVLAGVGTIIVATLQALIVFSSSAMAGTYIVARISLTVTIVAIIVAVVLALRDKELNIYMEKWIFSGIRVFIIIPILLKILEAGIMGLIFAGLIILIYGFYGIKFMCPRCKKGYALKNIDTLVVNEEDIVIKTQLKNRDKQTKEVLSVRDEYVPGKKTTYRLEYVCRYCGENCRKVKIRKVIKQ